MPIKYDPNLNTIFLCIIHKSIFNHHGYESARNVSSLEKSIFSQLKIPQENF